MADAIVAGDLGSRPTQTHSGTAGDGGVPSYTLFLSFSYIYYPGIIIIHLLFGKIRRESSADHSAATV